MILVEEREGLMFLNRQTWQQCLLVGRPQRCQEDVARRQAGEDGRGGVVGNPALRAHVVVDQLEEGRSARDCERKPVTEPAAVDHLIDGGPDGGRGGAG